MPKFEVNLWEKIVHSIEVEAEDEQEAIEIAKEVVNDAAQELKFGSSQGYNSCQAYEKES